MSYERVNYSDIESEVDYKGETLTIHWGASLLYEKDHGSYYDPPSVELVSQEAWVDRIIDGEGEEIKTIDPEMMAFALAWIDETGIIEHERHAEID